MSLVENIIGGALLMTIFVTIGIVITTQSVQQTQETFSFRQAAYLSDKHQGGLNTIMILTEPETRQSYSQLIGRAIYENQPEIALPTGGIVNITDLFENALNTVYGRGNYYAEIRPYITDIHVRLVFDGTNSLDHERRTITENLEQLITNTKTQIPPEFVDANITFRVLIVSEDASLCDPFDEQLISGFAGCVIITRDDAYGDEGLFSEPEFGFDTFNTIYPPVIAYEADWSVGVARSIAELIEAERPIRPESSIIIIFPITDELTSGSIPNECYTSESPLRENTGITARDENALRWHAVICGLCTPDCPLERSERQIEQLTTYIDTNEAYEPLVTIVGVFSEDCETRYPESLMSLEPYLWEQYTYIHQYRNDAMIPTEADAYHFDTTMCDLDGCTGCETNTDDPGLICFRNSCARATEDQLQALTERYRGGSVVNLRNADNLPREIVDRVVPITEDKIFRIGEKREEDSRFVATYSILLPNNERVPFTVWIYEDREFDISVPIVSIRAEPSAVPPGQVIRLVSDITTPTGVTRVRLTPEPSDEPIDLSLTGIISISDRYTHQGAYDTTGLLDGSYAVSYEVYDTAFNRFEGVAEDVFEIDLSLMPFPGVDNVLIIPETQLQNKGIEIIVTIDATPIGGFDRSDVRGITIRITAPSGDVREVELEEQPSGSWTSTFDSGEDIGTHTVEVVIEDEFGRVEVFSGWNFEVVEKIACTSTEFCRDNPDLPNYCTGEQTDEYYCSPNRAAEGEYAADQQSCESGLRINDDDMCEQRPIEAVNIVFVPLDFQSADIPRFRSFSERTMDDYLRTTTPMRECTDADLQDQLFVDHYITDTDCASQCTQARFNTCTDACTTQARQNDILTVPQYRDYCEDTYNNGGCGSNTACLNACAQAICQNLCIGESIDACLADAAACANRIPDTPDLVIGVTSFGWPLGTGIVLGATRLNLMTNVNWIGGSVVNGRYIDPGYLTVLHESGHSFGLSHVNCPVDARRVPVAAEACIPSAPNRMDCTEQCVYTGTSSVSCTPLNSAATPCEYLMGYAGGAYYGPNAYTHMESRAFFRNGLEVCADV